MSKGSGRRPRAVTLEKFEDNWNRIFGSGTSNQDGDRKSPGQGGVPDKSRKVHGSGFQGDQDNRACTRNNTR